MPKYRVELSAKLFIIANVEADSPEEAEELARDIGTPSGFAGNGGFDKLVGVDHHDVSLTCSDEVDIEEIDEM
tara:strand:+ start:3997 stop:4215 length:219 start_codon:yes stop_codon:yes gene_type:complete